MKALEQVCVAYLSKTRQVAQVEHSDKVGKERQEM